MSIISLFLVTIIALIHFYIMYLEMFSWTNIKTQRIFKTTNDFSEKTKVLAANQGLYNGFLAIGLVIPLFLSITNPENINLSKTIFVIFLSFIIVAGIYGGVTSNKRIFYIQSIPAIMALISLNY